MESQVLRRTLRHPQRLGVAVAGLLAVGAFCLNIPPRHSAVAAAALANQTAAATPVLAYKAAAQQVIAIGNGSEPRELDPTKAVGVPEHHILDSLFEGLTTLDPLTTEVRPGVADRWEISRDGRVYTFHIRDAAKWSDGSAVTAKDFVYSWRRLVTPAVGAEYAYLLYIVVGAQDFYDGKTCDPATIGVTAVDARTLKIRLTQPAPYLLSMVAMTNFGPLPAALVEKFHGDAQWTEPGNIVTNGPFKLAEWRLNEHVKLVPNEFYWDRDNVHPTAVYLLPIESQDAEERAFFSGEMQLTNEVNNFKVGQYLREQKRDPTTYHPFKVAPFLTTYFYLINTTKPPLNDKRVRQALSLTLDRSLLVDKVTGAGETPATGLTPPGMVGYPVATALNRSVTAGDIARAKALLAAAGYPDGKGLPKIEIHYNTSDNHKKIALAVQQMWKRTLGIDVTLFNEEWKVYQNTQQSKNYAISRYAWTADFGDPLSFLNLFVGNSGSNTTGFANAAYDRLLATAERTADPTKRLALLKSAENLLLDELPLLPVYFYTSKHLVAETLHLHLPGGVVRPWQGNSLDHMALKYFELGE